MTAYRLIEIGERYKAAIVPGRYNSMPTVPEGTPVSISGVAALIAAQKECLRTPQTLDQWAYRLRLALHKHTQQYTIRQPLVKAETEVPRCCHRRTALCLPAVSTELFRVWGLTLV